MSSDLTSDEKKQVIFRSAFSSGIQWAGAASATAGACVFAANKYSSTFRSRLGVSGKTALIVMSGLAAFGVASETNLIDAAKNPDSYLATIKATELQRHTTGAKQHKLQLHHRLANFWYDHPFRTIAMTGIPVVGGIFAYQSQNNTIKLSQQIMHTRLYGQASVICILLSTMAFQDWMRRHGRFE